MTQRSSDPQQVSDIILEQIIGKKPRKPQTYEMRLKRGEEKDIEFCKNYDERISEWEAKAEEVRLKAVEERKKDLQDAKDFKVKENPPVNVRYKDVLEDFIKAYPRFNLDKSEFSFINPYSESKEPEYLVHTLICYFLRNEKFLNSPLLNTELSKPSFNKGLLIIGGYGNGKTSVMQTLIFCFSQFVKYIEQIKPSNKKELYEQFKINQCISSDIVNQYNLAGDKSHMDYILNPLMSKEQLYIDDILREQIGNNFGKRNIFLDVLTHRADRGFKTHLTLNYKEDGEDVLSTEDSLYMFRDKYDGRVHDRLFGLYNIIELKSKSFRR